MKGILTLKKLAVIAAVCIAVLCILGCSSESESGNYAPIAVDSVTIYTSALTLKPGESYTLSASVMPNNADDKTVRWSSSNTSIATVSDDGTVTMVGVGEVIISAKAGGKEARCAIIVGAQNNNTSDSGTQGGTTHVHNYSGGICTVCGLPKPFMVDATIDDSGVLTKYRGGEKLVEIPDGVTGIGNNAFEDCSSLEIVVIPGSVTAIGSCAFKNCKNLMGVVISEGVTSIGSSAFEDCKSLMVLASPNAGNIYGSVLLIPNSVTRIGGNAFSGCYEITSVTIPHGVNIIGEYVFYGCTSLTSVKYNGTKEEWNAIVKWSDLNWSTDNYTITCTDGTIAKR